MDTQPTQPDITNISTETVAPKKRYIKKPKLEITKETTEEEIIARDLDTQPTKQKRGQSEKTKLALAEGRKKLQELNFQKRVERTQFITEQMNRKANRIAEEKLKILKDLNLDDDEDESILADVTPKTPKASKSVKAVKEVKEVKQVKTKKPPKVVYISEDEEDDEEEEQEIIYKVKPRSNNREKKQMQQVQQSQPQQINKPVYPSIVFY
jgi:hypothetical protein